MHLNSAASLSSLVQNKRHQMKLSQAELADKVGVSRLWINQVEKGKESINFSLVLRLLKTLDLSLKTVDITPAKEELNAVFDNF